MASDTVRIWVRAFTLASTPSSGAVVSSGSGEQSHVLRSQSGECTLSRSRGWNSEPAAWAPLSSGLALTIYDAEPPRIAPLADKIHQAKPTLVVDCNTGVQLTTLENRMTQDSAAAPTQSGAETLLTLQAAVAETDTSRTIGYALTFNYHQPSRTLRFDARLEPTPAYEAYASLNDGPIVTLFRNAPAQSLPTDNIQTAGVEHVALSGKVQLTAPTRPRPPSNLTVQ